MTNLTLDQEINKTDCQEQLFEIIVQLNCNRILGRLGCSKFRPPAHLTKSRDALSRRLRNMLDNNFPSSQLGWKHPQIQKLQNDLSTFETAYVQLEECKEDEMISSVKNVVRQTCVLTDYQAGLPSRLRNLGFPESRLDNRDVREVGKVSNYWRISRNLAVCSCRFRSCFENIDWCAVRSYNPSPSLKVSRHLCVHAEIQLLVLFESLPTMQMPRAIGTSKEACFLCDSFIRGDGRFSITGAHRQMYPQWTIPDLEEYCPQTVKSFRTVLSRVYNEVKQEYLAAQRKGPWRPYPLQSAINLHAVHLPTPSTSTLPLRSDTCNAVETQNPDRESDIASQSQSRLDEQCRYSIHRAADQKAIRASEITDERQIHFDSDSRDEKNLSLEVKVCEEFSSELKWVCAFASFSDFERDGLSKLPGQGYAGGSVYLEPAAESHNARTIQLASLPAGTELMLARSTSDIVDELEFVLAGGPNQLVRFRCRWHGT